jgi:hypothetical protein
MRLFDRKLCRYLTAAEEEKLRAVNPRAVQHFNVPPTKEEIQKMMKAEEKQSNIAMNSK